MSSKHYVMAKCSTFTRTQNLEVLKCLQEMDVKICECSDGSRINLDTLTRKQLTSLKKKVDSVDVPIDPKYQIE
jgi:hypothetical protein